MEANHLHAILFSSSTMTITFAIVAWGLIWASHAVTTLLFSALWLALAYTSPLLWFSLGELILWYWLLSDSNILVILVI